MLLLESALARSALSSLCRVASRSAFSAAASARACAASFSIFSVFETEHRNRAVGRRRPEPQEQCGNDSESPAAIDDLLHRLLLISGFDVDAPVLHPRAFVRPDRISLPRDDVVTCASGTPSVSKSFRARGAPRSAAPRCIALAARVAAAGEQHLAALERARHDTGETLQRLLGTAGELEGVEVERGCTEVAAAGAAGVRTDAVTVFAVLAFAGARIRRRCTPPARERRPVPLGTGGPCRALRPDTGSGRRKIPREPSPARPAWRVEAGYRRRSGRQSKRERGGRADVPSGLRRAPTRDPMLVFRPHRGRLNSIAPRFPEPISHAFDMRGLARGRLLGLRKEGLRWRLPRPTSTSSSSRDLPIARTPFRLAAPTVVAMLSESS